MLLTDNATLPIGVRNERYAPPAYSRLRAGAQTALLMRPKVSPPMRRGRHARLAARIRSAKPPAQHRANLASLSKGTATLSGPVTYTWEHGTGTGTLNLGLPEVMLLAGQSTICSSGVADACAVNEYQGRHPDQRLQETRGASNLSMCRL